MSIEQSETRPPTETVSKVALDLQDERLIASNGIGGAARAFGRRVRGGDLGSLPVIVGLVLIWGVFTILNQTFLTPYNIGNLLQQATPVGVISLGIVFVLLLGEIDLSVGSVAGLSSAIVAVVFVVNGLDLWLAVLAAMASGVVIGLVYGLLFTRFGVPSFVVTLAGLLAFLGLQLFVLGANGSINIPFTSPLVQFAQQWYLPQWLAYVVIVVGALIYALALFTNARRRSAAGLSALSAGGILVRVVALLVLLAIAASYLYLPGGRGVGAMFLLFVVLVVIADILLRRTRWGRSIFAVGGNVEAARRSGIKVRAVYMSVFAVCSFLAAIGGILLAARLGSATQSTGGTDVNLNAIAAAVIGGTSLFGGRGSAYSALLGILVIWSITNGLNLLQLDSSVRYMITGAVLLIAVIVDALSRRSRAASGRA
ncbi:MAG: sugar ABC transporter permease [Microbacterium sp.]|uniref:sugar ABC transporter permease n=1 Tax=Microbacterium sp. TaxID=51671 RepID=UPI0039E70BAC